MMKTEKCKRNQEISIKILKGAYMAKVAREYKLSSSRVKQILNRFCEKANRQIYLSEIRNPENRYFRPPKLTFLRENKEKIVKNLR